MRLKWHAKWRNPVRKGARSGLPARSSTLTPRGEAISMSFGFDRIAPPRRRGRLENEPHFPRFRSLRRSNPPQTISASFMSPYPIPPGRKNGFDLLRQSTQPGRKPACRAFPCSSSPFAAPIQPNECVLTLVRCTRHPNRSSRR